MKSIVQVFQRGVSTVLVIMLSAMVLLTFTDVAGRRLFNTPVFGANDVTEHLMAIIVFAGLPLLTLQRGHLSIDLLDTWLLRPGFRWWHKVIDVLIAGVLGLIAWQYFIAIGEARATSEVSQALSIPRWWMYAFISITTTLAALGALTVGPPHHPEHPEESNL